MDKDPQQVKINKLHAELEDQQAEIEALKAQVKSLLGAVKDVSTKALEILNQQGDSNGK